jgi:hypothetical protein
MHALYIVLIILLLFIVVCDKRTCKEVGASGKVVEGVKEQFSNPFSSGLDFPTKKIKYDGINYIVADTEGSDVAVVILDKLNKDALKLLSYMNKKYENECKEKPGNISVSDRCLTDKSSNKIRDRLNRLNKGYDPTKLIENVPSNNNTLTAYNDNKGERIAICLRSLDTNLLKPEFHKYNDLVFVLVHEMAHIANVRYDHDQEFWAIFGQMIQDAAECNIYTPVDYNINPIDYCKFNTTVLTEPKIEKNDPFKGSKTFEVHVNYNPMFDNEFNLDQFKI